MELYKELHKLRLANEHNYISIKAKRECTKLSTDRSSRPFVEKCERTENRGHARNTAFHVCYRYYHHASYNVIFNGPTSHRRHIGPRKKRT